MKKILFFVLASMIASLSVLPLFAEVMQNHEAEIQMTIPEKWISFFFRIRIKKMNNVIYY